jgi:hypothetical protein
MFAYSTITIEKPHESQARCPRAKSEGKGQSGWKDDTSDFCYG